ncbi:MAG: TonB-dependent receptor [Bacteroidia bacterium]|nr:TonB-dependent receptor [Bacteroidia bacterium]MDW8159670.1 TonB-dependent receptor [Bacteroidia bacterium]
MAVAPYLQGQTQLQVFVYKGSKQSPISQAEVTIQNTPYKCTTNDSGFCTIALKAGNYKVRARFEEEITKYKTIRIKKDSIAVIYFDLLKDALLIDTLQIIAPSPKTELQEKPFMETIPIETEKIRKITFVKHDESILQLTPGVAGSSEFSSQYRVRGGNYDENLVYINGVEIYRPFLVRSGQMEGLGLINFNLASDVSFSTGGFMARYGDKLSSVLDVTYSKPTTWKGSLELGLLTANLHLEGYIPHKKDSLLPSPFSFVAGLRRFSTRYLLSTLDAQGQYLPEFWDGQFLLHFTPHFKKHKHIRIRQRKDGKIDTLYGVKDPLRISVLGIIQRNNFLFRPQSRETTFGSFQAGLRLFIGFEGEEATKYITSQGALIFEWIPSLRFKTKTIISAVASEEAELFTVEGGYRISDISTNFGSDQFNQEIGVRGIGSEIRHARNFLEVRALSLWHQSEIKLGRNFYKYISDKNKPLHTLEWGIRVQYEYIEDLLKEWNALDSADYLWMTESINAANKMYSQRVSAYLQENWKINRSFFIVGGIRANYWSINKEFFITPRLQVVYTPIRQALEGEKRKYQFRAALGAYFQPPFYRELRDFQGRVYTHTLSQKSYHAILGFDYIFQLFNRTFKVFTEVYYKHLFDILPYQIDNVRIRYFPEDSTGSLRGVGYAYGWDFRINGQFIKDIDSWFSISLLRTRENVPNDGQGFIRRPTDQLVMFNFYFQDEVPKIPSIKAHMNFIFASGLPFGPPASYQARTLLNAPYYLRVDLGVSKEFIFEKKLRIIKNWKIYSLWLGLEVFNLFGRANTVSFQWVRDFDQIFYAVPNYLSARLLNLRIIARF